MGDVDRRFGYFVAAEARIKEAQRIRAKYGLLSEYWANIAEAQVYSTLANTPTEIVEPLYEVERRKMAWQAWRHRRVLAELKRTAN